MKVIHKVVERGHEDPQFGRNRGQNLKCLEKNTKGLNKVPNSIFDQNSRSNEFGPRFVPSTLFFVLKNFTHTWAFTLFILSNHSLFVCIFNSQNLLTCIWVLALKHKDKYNNKWSGQVSKAQVLCILKECHGGQLKLECTQSKRDKHFQQFMCNPEFCTFRYL